MLAADQTMHARSETKHGNRDLERRSRDVHSGDSGGAARMAYDSERRNSTWTPWRSGRGVSVGSMPDWTPAPRFAPRPETGWKPHRNGRDGAARRSSKHCEAIAANTE